MECQEREREREGEARQAFDVIIACLVKAADNHGPKEEPEGEKKNEIEIKANNKKGGERK